MGVVNPGNVGKVRELIHWAMLLKFKQLMKIYFSFKNLQDLYFGKMLTTSSFTSCEGYLAFCIYPSCK